MKEKQGDFQGAVHLYLKAGLPTRAARVAMEQPEVSSNSDSVGRIVASLVRGEFYEQVSGLTSSSSRRRSERFSFNVDVGAQRASSCWLLGNPPRRSTGDAHGGGSEILPCPYRTFLSSRLEICTRR